MVLVGIGTTIYNCYNGKIMSKFSSTERQTIEALLEKISIECKNEYIINFYIIRDVYSIYVPDIIRKPLHFFFVYVYHKLCENNTLFRLHFSIDYLQM